MGNYEELLFDNFPMLYLSHLRQGFQQILICASRLHLKFPRTNLGIMHLCRRK